MQASNAFCCFAGVFFYFCSLVRKYQEGCRWRPGSGILAPCLHLRMVGLGARHGRMGIGRPQFVKGLKSL